MSASRDHVNEPAASAPASSATSVPAASVPAASVPATSVRAASAAPAPVAAVPSRRFGRRAALLGAFAAAVSLRAAPARAETNEGQLLLGLWRREQGLALAYGQQEQVEPERFGLARLHANTHAAAIATELAAVGLGTGKPPRTPDELDSGAHRLATARPADVLAAAALVEEAMVEAYKAALLELTDAKIAMTAATILASHAQHLLIFTSAARVS